MDEDDTLFDQAMRGVRKINLEPRAAAPRPKQRPLPRPQPVKPQPPSSNAHGPVSTTATWVLKESGVSNERLRQLAAGRPGVDFELDLHGMSREQAYTALSLCMDTARTKSWRVLCLVHGRGMHSSDGKAVLKKAVYIWLKEGPYAGRVLAVIPKPGTAGGSCLVLLRRKR